MAIDEDDIEETEEETPKAQKKGGKKGKKPAKQKELNATIFNGGPRNIPPRPEGAPKAVRARTFHTWVQSLCKRELQPHHFVCELPDGETKNVPLTRSKSGTVLVSECVSTIETFEPVNVEAFSRDENTDEEMTLGRWAFPKKPEDPNAVEALATPIPPGYLVEEGDSDAIRLVKATVHMIADAYRYNLDAMSRVMEVQANAFARERESTERTITAREKAAALRANRYRVAPANATDVPHGAEEEEEVEEPNGLFNTFMQTMMQEYARKSAAEAVATAAGAAKTP